MFFVQTEISCLHPSWVWPDLVKWNWKKKASQSQAIGNFAPTIHPSFWLIFFLRHMELFYSVRSSWNPGKGCECEWKSRFQTEGEIKSRTKDEEEGRKKSAICESLKKKGTVPVSIEREVSKPISIEREAVVPISIEREAFAETMIDVSDRREPCSPSLKRPSWW